MKLFKKLLLPVVMVWGLSLVLVQAQNNGAVDQGRRYIEPAPSSSENIPAAFNGEGFTLIPAEPNAINTRKFIFELKPGQSAEEEVIVKNLSSEKGSDFYLYGADPTFSAQGTPAYKTRDATGKGEGKWINFEEPMIYLEPLEEKKVKFTLQVPDDAPYGDYRIGIAMEKIQKDSNNNAITIATRVILHSDIKVTDDPQAIPKQNGEDTAITSPVKPVQNQPWKSYYFWISLGLFLLSLIILMWITWKERKIKKLPSVATSMAKIKPGRLGSGTKKVNNKKAVKRKTSSRKKLSSRKSSKKKNLT